MMPTAERLGGDFCVYVPDLPGFGESAHPAKTLDVPGLADALAAWMGPIGVPRAALLGNSFACQIIIDLAARHPQRVAHTLVHTAPERLAAVTRRFLSEGGDWR